MLILQAAARAWVPNSAGVWRDGTVPVAFEFAATAPNSSFDWQGAATEALNAWNTNLQRVQLATATPTGRPWYDNGRNELFFADKFYGEAFPTGVLAITGTTVDLGEPVEADIVFNSAAPWAIYRGTLRTERAEFRRVVLHELGHLLGLDHPDEAGQQTSAVMNSVVGDVDTLAADDQAGVHALYDRGPGGPPIIVGQPQRTAVRVGMPAAFDVAAGGRGPMRYSWRREGVPIPGATDAELMLESASMADAGTYSVVVSNAAGAVTSSGAALTVVPADPAKFELVSSAPVTLAAGEDFTISVRYNGGSPPFRYQWTRNGAPFLETESSLLKLAEVQLGDAGDYALVVSNPAGSVTLPAVRLTVTPGVPPRFLTGVTSAAYGGGSRVTLNAAISGTPRATYQWLKNGSPIPLATNATLTIDSFQFDDAGSYALRITTPFGQATSDAGVITVLEGAGPKITQQSQSFADYPGNNIVFRYDYDGTGQSWRWLKDGVPLANEVDHIRIQGATLALLGIDKRDAGVYVGEVSGPSGIARTNPARLQVLDPPRPVISGNPAPHTVAVGGEVILGASVAGDRSLFPASGPPLTYQWFKDGQPIAGQTLVPYSFKAQLADAGRYFVRVSTGNLSTDSEPADVTVTSGAPPLIGPHVGSFYVNSGDGEAVRLAGVGLEVTRRRMASNTGGTATLNLISTLPGVPPRGFYPDFGVYTITVTKDGISETTRPFTFGILPAVLPWLRVQPGGGAYDLGAGVRLDVNAVAFSPQTYRWTKNGVVVAGATDSYLFFFGFTARDVGTYQVAVTTAAGTVTSEPATLELRTAGLPEIREHPLSQTGTAGSTVTLRVVAAGGTLRYQWQRDEKPIAGATTNELRLPNLSAANAGSYTAVVTNDVGSRVTRAADLRVLATSRPPEILIQPAARRGVLGGEATFLVGADGAPLPDRYQWRRNGVAIPGATDARLILRGIRMEDAGSYTVVVTNAIGSTTSEAAALSVDAGGRLVNLATRASVGSGTNILIAGFVIGGSTPRSVLVRGIGDQLSAFGVGGVLRNPVLKIFDSQSRQIATNDDWNSGGLSDASEVVRRRTLVAAAQEAGAFPLRNDTQDAALIATLTPGSYTAQVTGFVDTTGVALVEIYELGAPGESRLVNLSSRAVVGTGANILIPGLVLTGQAPRRLLIRAVGPGLADLGVGGALADPTMVVLRGNETVAQNDNWSDQPGAAALAPAMAAVGAFPLKAGSRDAALLLDLPPGSYTVQVAGVGGTTGVALVEVYEVLQ